MSEESKQNSNSKMRVKFFTLGCKVNQYETQAMIEKFLSLGCQTTKEKADLYVINTCTVTSRADSKSKQAILRAKKENPKAKVAVCGCLAQLNSDYIKKIGVDYIIPQDKKNSLPDIVLGTFSNSAKQGNESPGITHFYNHRAFVKIQDGCDNFCSFCKIPYLRGPSHSKGRDEVLEEIKKVSKVHKEIVLCGVNLGLWGGDLNPGQDLGGLIEAILKLPSLGRLRLSSLEPILINSKLLTLLGNSKLCPHLHLPFQYGDDRILKEMDKKETVGLYEEVVRQARKINPEIAISCDIMVGFPYETEKSFQNTVNFLRKIKPMRMHIFTFSPREKTKFAASKIDGQKDIRRRYNFLKTKALDFSLEYKKKFIGKILNMVAEEKKDKFITGYTENYIKVYVKGDIALGEIVPVRIEKVERDRVYAFLAG